MSLIGSISGSMQLAGKLRAMSHGLELAGRTALVTGASGGIGSAICRRLAYDAAGIAVVYGSNAGSAEALAAEIVSGGGNAQVFGCDMADPGAPERLIDDVEAVLGPVEILSPITVSPARRAMRTLTRRSSTTP